jgi:hypothetical protein
VRALAHGSGHEDAGDLNDGIAPREDAMTTRGRTRKLAKMLRSHTSLILNYFRAKKQLNSGIVEGLNNKLKLVTRKSYGFRSAEPLKIALYHAIRDFPTPPLARRFV